MTYEQHGYGYSYAPVSQYAGFWRRVGALLLDSLILSVGLELLGALLGVNGSGGGLAYGYSPGEAAAWNIVTTIVGAAYYGYLEGVRGQTLGKMACGIRVVDGTSGAVIGIPRAVGRYFASILSGLALGLGYLWMLWDPRKQTWHDKIVGSVVVRA